MNDICAIGRFDLEFVIIDNDCYMYMWQAFENK